MVKCSSCRGEWMVCVTRLYPTSMHPSHNINSTSSATISTVRQSTVLGQLVYRRPIIKMFFSASVTTEFDICRDVVTLDAPPIQASPLQVQLSCNHCFSTTCIRSSRSRSRSRGSRDFLLGAKTFLPSK